MALPPFLINHGEKVAVAAVALLSGYMVWSTASDETMTAPRPASQVEADFLEIERAISDPGNPNLRPGEDVVGHISTRLALPPTFEEAQTVAFLQEIPSIGKQTSNKFPPFLIGYEIHAPEIEVDDLIGRLQVTLTLPESSLGISGRIRDSRIDESRTVDGTQYTNYAEVLGVQVQRRQGDGPWEPLTQANNPIGMLSAKFSGERLQVVVDDVNEWQTYEFRARLVSVATGPITEGAPSLGNEVMVFAGKSPLPPTPSVWEEQDTLSWEGVPLSIPTAERGDDEFFANLRRVFPEMAAVAGTNPRQSYFGPWSNSAAELVGSTTRFALLRVSPPIAQGQPPRVRFGLTRKVGDVWLPLYEDNVEVGEMVGDKDVVLPHPVEGLRKRFDLSTPFKLIDVNLQAQRITHYEIRNTVKGNGRALEITPRFDRAARTVMLENVTSGEKMEMVQLGRPLVRPSNERQVNYPDYKAGTINERQLFESGPMAFEQPVLNIPEPIWHEPNDPLLKQLFPDAPSTVVPYIELPDGRFLVIDELNDRIIRVFEKDGVAKSSAQVGQDEEAAEDAPDATEDGPDPESDAARQ